MAESNSKLKILIVDDHRMFRDGLRTMLQAGGGVEIIGEAADGIEALAVYFRLRPNITLMNITMPLKNGIEAARQILAEDPSAKIIILTTHTERRIILEMIKLGIAGYVLKDCGFEVLLQAIDAVREGEAYLCPPVARLMLRELQSRRRGNDHTGSSPLTYKEREVLQLIAEGKPLKEIATILDLSVKTIETHRKRMMNKLHLGGTAELTKYAIQEGLTSAQIQL